MNLRIDKVIRSVGFGFRKVYSIILTNDGLYLIRTGNVGALKHYQIDPASAQPATTRPTDRDVRELQANEARIDAEPFEQLLADRESYQVRLEAIEEVETKAGKTPAMLIKVTGSDHYLTFPFASFEEVQTFQRALNKWSFKS